MFEKFWPRRTEQPKGEAVINLMNEALCTAAAAATFDEVALRQAMLTAVLRHEPLHMSIHNAKGDEILAKSYVSRWPKTGELTVSFEARWDIQRTFNPKGMLKYWWNKGGLVTVQPLNMSDTLQKGDSLTVVDGLHFS